MTPLCCEGASQDTDLLVPRLMVSAEKLGETFLKMDTQMTGKGRGPRRRENQRSSLFVILPVCFPLIPCPQGAATLTLTSPVGLAQEQRPSNTG